MHQKALSLPKEYTIKGNEHKTQSTGLCLQPRRYRYSLLFFFVLIFIYLFGSLHPLIE